MEYANGISYAYGVQLMPEKMVMRGSGMQDACLYQPDVIKMNGGTKNITL